MASKSLYSYRGLKVSIGPNSFIELQIENQSIRLAKAQVKALSKVLSEALLKAEQSPKLDNDDNELGIYLKRHRETSNVSQAELANFMGYSTSQFVSNWERGIAPPPVDQLKKICAKTGGDAEEAYRMYEKRVVRETRDKLVAEFKDVGR